MSWPPSTDAADAALKIATPPPDHRELLCICELGQFVINALPSVHTCANVSDRVAAQIRDGAAYELRDGRRDAIATRGDVAIHACDDLMRLPTGRGCRGTWIRSLRASALRSIPVKLASRQPARSNSGHRTPINFAKFYGSSTRIRPEATSGPSRPTRSSPSRIWRPRPLQQRAQNGGRPPPSVSRTVIWCEVA